MKKYLMYGLAAVALASCSKTDVYDANRSQVQDTYDQAFRNYVGVSIASNQSWGFGGPTTWTRGLFTPTRSQSAPSVPDISAPWTESDVTTYLTTAKEPTAANVIDNHDDSAVKPCQWYATGNGKLSTLMNNYNLAVGQSGITQDDKDWYTKNIKPLFDSYGYYNLSSENAYTILMKLKEYKGDYNFWDLTVNSEGGYQADETFVLKFKITEEYTGTIGVAASEGYVKNGNEYTNVKADPYCARTIVVKDKWNINDNQRIGSGGLIVVANGGEVNIASGKQLELVNHARLVVLSGGKVTGDGSILVSNGNGSGEENYVQAGGEINISGTFNNNFGKFYNYGKVKVGTYATGGSESNFYNHGIVHITDADALTTRNARVFNACQWYVEHDMQIYILEQVQGASFIVDGELRCNGGNDGTSDPNYVALDAGALVKCGTLYNNGTTWYGTGSNGYAVLTTGQVTYLNWDGTNNPMQFGYFTGNLYIELKDGTNDPEGNGNHVNNNEAEYPYRASYKVFDLLARGNVTEIKESTSDNDELIPASTGFVKGESGCTPGYKGKVPDTPVIIVENDADIRIIAEDLSATEESDFDFNDVVIDVKFTSDNTATLTLQAAGGTLPLRIAENDDYEVHKLFGVSTKTMVNTHASKYATNGYGYADDKEPVTDILVTGIDKANWGNDIKLEVQKDGVWYEITAKTGDPAAKLCVDPKFQWANEKVSIKSMYSKFTGWVSDPTVMWY